VYVAMFGPSIGRARAALFVVNLDYEGANDCPDTKEFEALVEAGLGYDPFSEDASDHVLLQITRDGDTLNGIIEWRDSTGRWIGDQTFPLASTDCLRLARTLALALTVQIRLLAKAASPNRGMGPAEDTNPPPAAPPPKPAPPSPGSPLRPEEHASAPGPPGSPAGEPWPAFALSAGPSIGFGMSSRPVLLARVLGTVGWPSLSLELGAEASLPTTTRRADGAGFSQQHLLVSSGACALLQHWSACFLAKAGEVRMAGENVDRPTSAVVPIVETGARVGVVHRLGRRFFVGVHAEGLTNAIRWTATLDQVPVWTAPRFAAVLGVDVGIHSPEQGDATSR
jgi:hypothetical protein